MGKAVFTSLAEKGLSALQSNRESDLFSMHILRGSPLIIPHCGLRYTDGNVPKELVEETRFDPTRYFSDCALPLFLKD